MFGSAHAGEPNDCVRALAQIKILKQTGRVYKKGPGDSRTYLSDQARPSEVDRLQKLAAVLCSDEDTMRHQQEADANRLVSALGVQCATYRDELVMLQRPTSRASAQDIERRETFVAEYCPNVSVENTWLPDRVIIRRPE
jgi:hypothetical protein